MEPYKREALYWHCVWEKEKRPSSGWLHDTMAKWRRLYHYAVRKIKRKGKLVRAEKLFEAAMQSDLDLLKEMKKIKNGGGGTKAESADNISGAEGSEEIVAKFRDTIVLDLRQI